ncbi:MAG: MBL fold metallo-hydrolase [Candidatus Krumholzibacteriota bacterium]|nr:MBL fold metallo-hydrolase [Candidatus Krumholzibacteriota bacterium]
MKLGVKWVFFAIACLMFPPDLISSPLSGGGQVIVSGEEDGAVNKGEDITIRVIYNNIVEDPGLEGEWGFGCVIEGMEKTILFDTGGDGEVLLKNMKKMGIDPEAIDIVVISHEHWDHIGGLEKFIAENDQVLVFAPSSFSENYTKLIKKKHVRNIAVKGPMEICRNVYTSGEQGDEIVEQALFLKTAGGIVVITGCAHPGIVMFAEMAVGISGEAPLLVMGGFHLRGISDKDLNDITGRFREIGVANIGASHCTGDEAIAGLKKGYGDRFIPTGAGAVIKVSELKR